MLSFGWGDGALFQDKSGDQAGGEAFAVTASINALIMPQSGMNLTLSIGLMMLVGINRSDIGGISCLRMLTVSWILRRKGM